MFISNEMSVFTKSPDHPLLPLPQLRLYYHSLNSTLLPLPQPSPVLLLPTPFPTVPLSHCEERFKANFKEKKNLKW